MRRRPQRKRASRVQEIDRSRLSESELEKLQAFEDLNKGFKSAVRMIIPTMLAIVALVFFGYWFSSFRW